MADDENKPAILGRSTTIRSFARPAAGLAQEYHPRLASHSPAEMGGMGLARRRNQDVQASSTDAEELLQQLQRAVAKRTPSPDLAVGADFITYGTLEVAEQPLEKVRSVLITKTPDGVDALIFALHQMEALDLFLEEQDAALVGLTEESRTALCKLVFASWLALCERLQTLEALTSEKINNWKYVLRRAVATAEQLGEGIDEVQQAAVVLEDLVGNQEPNLQAACQALPYSAALQRYLEQPGRRGDKLGGDSFDLTNPERLQEAQEAAEREGPGSESLAPREGDGEGDGEGEEGGWEQGQQEEALQFQELLMRRLPLSNQGHQGGAQGGSLAALHDVMLCPKLLRVAAHLAPENPVRQEVEQQVGGPPDSAAWRAALTAADEAAEDAAEGDDVEVVEVPAGGAATHRLPSLVMGPGMGSMADFGVADHGYGSPAALINLLSPTFASGGMMGAGSREIPSASVLGQRNSSTVLFQPMGARQAPAGSVILLETNGSRPGNVAGSMGGLGREEELELLGGALHGSAFRQLQAGPSRPTSALSAPHTMARNMSFSLEQAPSMSDLLQEDPVMQGLMSDGTLGGVGPGGGATENYLDLLGPQGPGAAGSGQDDGQGLLEGLDGVDHLDWLAGDEEGQGQQEKLLKRAAAGSLGADSSSLPNRPSKLSRVT